MSSAQTEFVNNFHRCHLFFFNFMNLVDSIKGILNFNSFLYSTRFSTRRDICWLYYGTLHLTTCSHTYFNVPPFLDCFILRLFILGLRTHSSDSTFIIILIWPSCLAHDFLTAAIWFSIISCDGHCFQNALFTQAHHCLISMALN